jgi:hypothetical protein
MTLLASVAPHAVVPAPPDACIVWLAAADARGHLMRAHLVTRALARRGLDVEIVTTSDAGQEFLARLGTASTVLSCHYAMQFDAAQNLDRRRSQACVLRYLVDPRRAARDAFVLRRMARGADLLVNDFHPLPLILPQGLGAPVAHVYGTHLWETISRQTVAAAPRRAARFAAAALVRRRDRAFARLEHSLIARAGVLPPLVAPPTVSSHVLRGELGLDRRARLAAVYLNPHFREARIAEALERGLMRAGFTLYAVGEGFARRPGWRAVDARFTAVAAAADLLVSAPGMGALAAWSCFRTPLLALLTDQPEQRANARDLGVINAAPWRQLPVIDLDEASVARAASSLVGATPLRPDPRRAALDVTARWADALCRLAFQARDQARSYRRES